MVRAVPDGAVWLVYPLCGVPAGYITPGQMSSLPLCATAIVFSRMLDGKEYTFGVSGKLWHNGLVMYDHQTDTLWSGITGKALVGPLQGKQITRVPHVNIYWFAWRVKPPWSQAVCQALAEPPLVPFRRGIVHDGAYHDGGWRVGGAVKKTHRPV